MRKRIRKKIKLLIRKHQQNFMRLKSFSTFATFWWIRRKEERREKNSELWENIKIKNLLRSSKKFTKLFNYTNFEISINNTHQLDVDSKKRVWFIWHGNWKKMRNEETSRKAPADYNSINHWIGWAKVSKQTEAARHVGVRKFASRDHIYRIVKRFVSTFTNDELWFFGLDMITRNYSHNSFIFIFIHWYGPQYKPPHTQYLF
jgi:hypothetical protein